MISNKVIVIKMSYKVVIATYTVEECFVIPKNIDLENKEQVESYWIKYNNLNIILTNGKHIKIDSNGWIQDNGLKYPDIDGIKIEEACDYGINNDNQAFDEVDIGIFEKEEIKKIDEEEEEEENISECLCGQRNHKNDICSHGIADGVCCECHECHSQNNIEEDEEEEEEEKKEYMVVKVINYQGKNFLKCKKTNIIYDKDAYVNDGKVIKLGIWNNETNSIDFDISV